MPYTTLTTEDLEILSREELVDKVIELQDLLESTASETKETAPREHTEKRDTRIVHVDNGHIAMGYVLGKHFVNSHRVQDETRSILKSEGERTDGLCISAINSNTLKLFSHSTMGLDLMEERVKVLIQEAQDKIKRGELRQRHRRDNRYQYDNRHRHSYDHHRDGDYHRGGGYRRSLHDEAHLYRGIH